MKFTFNLTDTDRDLARFSGPEDLRNYLTEHHMDGVELQPCLRAALPEGWEPRDVAGVHLMYYPTWVDFWKGDSGALDREFGDRKQWQMYYGGGTREGFLEPWRKQLELAREIGAEYVVFHVSECTLEECLTYRFHYTDREVCQAACEVINELLDGQSYPFRFLVENLWWSGLNLRDNAVTRELLEGIHYENKGLILDTGHLLNTNLELRTQEEGLRYIHQTLDRMGELTHYIKGVHLNQSLSGAYVQSVTAAPPQLTGDYWQRLDTLCDHVYKIDYHHPFTAAGTGELLERIRPDTVTFEFITRDRVQQADWLRRQWAALEKL